MPPAWAAEDLVATNDRAQYGGAGVRSDIAPSSDAVVVSRFRFSGNTAIASADLQAVVASYVNTSCDLARLRAAAERVTEEYRRKGHPLAKAYLPQQSITDGVVEIIVVEGRIGRLSIEGNRNYSGKFIRRYLTADNEMAPLTIEKLEHGLLLLNSQFTDLKVTANFAPGVEPGTTDIVVRVEDSFPLHLSLNTNNYGSEYVSRYRFGVTGEWVNALIPGSHLTVGSTIGDQADRMKVISGSYTLPVNSIGTVFGVSALSGNFDIGKDFADLDMHNEEVSVDGNLSHPLFKSRKTAVTGTLGLRVADAKYFVLDQLNSHDNTSVGYVGLHLDNLSNGGKSFMDVTYSRGLGATFNGTAPGDPLASRKDASNEFSAFDIRIARYQPMSDVFSALVTVAGKWSGESLLAGEQWLIGGVNSVHGYSLGEGAGDSGYSASLALRANPLADKDALMLSAYLDYGYAHKRVLQPGEHENTNLTGVGLGIFSHVNTIAPTDLHLDIGFPLDPSTNYIDEKPVISFDTAIRF